VTSSVAVFEAVTLDTMNVYYTIITKDEKRANMKIKEILHESRCKI